MKNYYAAMRNNSYCAPEGDGTIVGEYYYICSRKNSGAKSAPLLQAKV